jgi:hypothetical protein
MTVELDSSTVVLANIYLIMALQLGFNWSATACGTSSYLFQLGFIALMAVRLLFHELNHNKVTSNTLNKVFMFTMSGFLLALGIYQAITVANNASSFYYDPTTKTGNEVCFQNRIVFVGEIVIIGLTLAKDIYFLCISPESV